MPLNLTEEQIIQLAPDAASVKAGKGLAVPGKWVLLACSERAVWGHCQGSGKEPLSDCHRPERYRFQMFLSQPEIPL